MNMKKIFVKAVLPVALLAATQFPVVQAQEVGSPQILWQNVGGLAPAFGQQTNVGVAGMLHGMSNGYLVVAGGANFPNGGPAVGGKKVTYSDLYVYKISKKGLVEVSHTNMPYPVAYGSSVTTPNGVYYLGGSTDSQGAKEVSLVKVNNDGKASISKVGVLPFAWKNGVAAYDNGFIYFGLGNQDGKASNKLYKLNVTSGAVTELASLPGAPREQSVAQILNGKLYVFGGGTKTCLTDGYAYDIANNTWSTAANVEINQQAVSLYGGNSIKLNNDEMLVIGGFNKNIYDWAVENLTTLKGDELKAFKDKYFNMPVRDYNWNKQILVYNAKTNTWKALGDIPFNAPCGEGLVKAGNNIISINGEIKPGVRTNTIYQGFIIK